MRERRDRANRSYARLLLEHVLAPHPAGPGADPRAFAALIVVSGVTEVITMWLRGSVELDRRAIVAQITWIGLTALG